MGHAPVITLAHRFAAWQRQAHRCHRILRMLTEHADLVDQPGDGTVLVRVSAGAWAAAASEAADAPPEPLDGAPAAANG